MPKCIKKPNNNLLLKIETVRGTNFPWPTKLKELSPETQTLLCPSKISGEIHANRNLKYLDINLRIFLDN